MIILKVILEVVIEGRVPFHLSWDTRRIADCCRRVPKELVSECSRYFLARCANISVL
jgi:hypothetical protein